MYDKCMISNKDGEKKTVSLSFRDKLWEKYQVHCKKNDLTPSNEIQDFMRGELL